MQTNSLLGALKWPSLCNETFGSAWFAKFLESGATMGATINEVELYSI